MARLQLLVLTALLAIPLSNESNRLPLAGPDESPARLRQVQCLLTAAGIFAGRDLDVYFHSRHRHFVLRPQIDPNEIDALEQAIGRTFELAIKDLLNHFFSDPIIVVSTEVRQDVREDFLRLPSDQQAAILKDVQRYFEWRASLARERSQEARRNRRQESGVFYSDCGRWDNGLSQVAVSIILKDVGAELPKRIEKKLSPCVSSMIGFECRTFVVICSRCRAERMMAP